MKLVITLPIFVYVFLCVAGCKKNREVFPPAAEIYENKTQKGITTATIHAGFSGLDITERGICWSTSPEPTTAGLHLKAGSGEGNITEVITGLTPGRTMFSRAYAINKGGISYSQEIQFTLDKPPGIITHPPLSRGTNTALIRVQISSFSGSSSGSFGICYAKHPAPTLSDQVSTKTSFPGNDFTREILNLDPGTTYYARAFAELSSGVFFGNEISFTTFSGTLSDIDGNLYFTVKIGNQEWMVSNLRTSRFSNGIVIPQVASFNWSSHNGPAQAFFLDQPTYLENYGRYYSQEAVVSANGLAPQGWRIPSLQDWQQLFNYVGPDSVAIRLLSAQWYQAGADNSSGLTVLPTGMRYVNGGDQSPATTANFWTSTTESGYTHSITFGKTFYDMIPLDDDMRYGLSIRCIKN